MDRNRGWSSRRIEDRAFDQEGVTRKAVQSQAEGGAGRSRSVLTLCSCLSGWSCFDAVCVNFVKSLEAVFCFRWWHACEANTPMQRPLPGIARPSSVDELQNEDSAGRNVVYRTTKYFIKNSRSALLPCAARTSKNVTWRQRHTSKQLIDASA